MLNLTKRHWLMLGAVLLLLTPALLNYYLPLRIPSGAKHFSQIVTAENGQTLRAFADDHGIWRQRVSLDQVSPLYIEALLAYEDRYFWSHPGINPVSLLRAFWLNMRCHCIVSGGSTISMQVARILHPHSRTLLGKLYQVLRTLQLELLLSKRQILELYLNFAPFGGTIEGVEAASLAYLGKSSATLTHAEAALLAVLPQSPSRIRPDRYPHKAQKARDKVLDRLLLQKQWSAQTINDAKLELVYATNPVRPNNAPLLARKLSQRQPQQSVIHTSIDYQLQLGLQEHIKTFISSQPLGSSAAILVVDNHTNKVKAYVGSADFNDKRRYGHVDMVSAIRSPGSTLKPFVYGLAIDKGLIHSHSLLSDTPRHNSDYQPQNFSRGFSGPVTVVDALQRSLNVPAVQVLQHLGAKTFYNSLSSAGVRLSLPAHSQPNLSLALGGAGVSLWDLVSLYSSFAHAGQVMQPSYYLATNNQQKRFLLSPQASWISYKMLLDNPRPDSIASVYLAHQQNNLAWKTGTSYGFRDAWAIGTSQQYTIGVWLGRPDGTPMPGHYGGLNAAPLLFDIADRIHTQQQTLIKQPAKVIKQTICWPLGLPKAETRAEHCHQSYHAWLKQGVSPPTLHHSSASHWNINPLTLYLDPSNGKRADYFCPIKQKKATTIALWPKELEPWLDYRFTRRGSIPATSERCPQAQFVAFNDLKIVGVEQATVIKLLKADEKPLLHLDSIGGIGAKDWYVNGKHVATLAAGKVLFHTFTQIGTQQVLVIDEQGNSDKLEFSIQIDDFAARR